MPEVCPALELEVRHGAAVFAPGLARREGPAGAQPPQQRLDCGRSARPFGRAWPGPPGLVLPGGLGSSLTWGRPATNPAGCSVAPDPKASSCAGSPAHSVRFKRIRWQRPPIEPWASGGALFG